MEKLNPKTIGELNGATISLAKFLRNDHGEFTLHLILSDGREIYAHRHKVEGVAVQAMQLAIV